MATSTTVQKSSGTSRRKRTVKSRVIPVESVTKYTKPTQIEKVTETPIETPTKPEKVRPEKPNLTYVDYVEDAKVRWQIHSYEVNEAWQDMKKFYNLSSRYIVKAFNFSKEKTQQLIDNLNQPSTVEEVEEVKGEE